LKSYFSLFIEKHFYKEYEGLAAGSSILLLLEKKNDLLDQTITDAYF
jgi:hypothetical protein